MTSVLPVRRHFIGRHFIARQLKGDSSPGDSFSKRQLTAPTDNRVPFNRATLHRADKRPPPRTVIINLIPGRLITVSVEPVTNFHATLYKVPVPCVCGSNVMSAVVFGTSSKGKATVIYRNFEYVKERDNHCGTTSWRCQKYQSMQCKARLITSGNRIVSDRQPEHTHPAT